MAPAESTAFTVVKHEAEPDTADATTPPEDPGSKTVEVTVGEHRLLMTVALSARDLLNSFKISSLDSRRPQDAVEQFQLVAPMVERHVVSHDYDDPDILEQEAAEVTRIYVAWSIARKEGALPKESGNRSQRRSQKRH